MMDGLLVVDKPEGMTSFDVVRQVRRLLRVKKAGHTGTLDPMATGVLPICIGRATRLVSFILEGDKTYETTVRLGAATDTQDRSGKVVAEAAVPNFSEQQLSNVLAGFQGEISQIPPMYSAVRVDGQRLYDLARQGKEVERAERRVTIYRIDLLSWNLPDLRLRVHCSKGTYIRTLGHDLGETLGCHAHLTQLRRIASGSFDIARAIGLNALKEMSIEEIGKYLLPEREIISFMPQIELNREQAQRVMYGQRLSINDLAMEMPADGQRFRLTVDGEPIAIVEWVDGSMRYLRVLSENS